MSFPVKISVVTILGVFMFLSVGYFFCYHLFLITYNITELERKYKFRKFDKEVVKLSILEKLKLCYNRTLEVLKSQSIFDLYWPD